MFVNVDMQSNVAKITNVLFKKNNDFKKINIKLEYFKNMNLIGEVIINHCITETVIKVHYDIKFEKQKQNNFIYYLNKFIQLEWKKFIILCALFIKKYSKIIIKF